MAGTGQARAGRAEARAPRDGFTPRAGQAANDLHARLQTVHHRMAQRDIGVIQPIDEQAGLIAIALRVLFKIDTGARLIAILDDDTGGLPGPLNGEVTKRRPSRACQTEDRSDSRTLPIQRGGVPKEGVADKELSVLLARNQLVPIVHNTTYDALRNVSPMLASRSGLDTAEDSMAVVAAKIAELVAL